MRLIDADALMKIVDAEIERAEEEMRDAEERPSFYTDDFRKHKSYTAAGMAHIAQDILEAPTIDAVPRWIPCEEKLPEKYDQYLCCTREGIFHTPCLDDSKLAIRWAKDEDIVAWMPLPEPYKGERKDNG